MLRISDIHGSHDWRLPVLPALAGVNSGWSLRSRGRRSGDSTNLLTRCSTGLTFKTALGYVSDKSERVFKSICFIF